MRGAKVVRRRSVTNPGESGGGPGDVNGGQADGGGPGLLAGGSALSGSTPTRRDVAATGPQPAVPPTPAGGQPATPPGALADQVPAAPPPASLVQATHPHPRRPGSSRSR